MKWVHSVIPEFDVGSHFIAVSKSKHSAITQLKGIELSKKDILVDDYNPNLLAWEVAGGTAVKYLNGINSPDSWYGYKLSQSGIGAKKHYSDIGKLMYDIVILGGVG
jgi:hypothetical protein